MTDLLAEEARLDPDSLWAWLGPLRATKCRVTKLPDGIVRWDFEWKFKRVVRLEDVEFIVNHELLHTKDNVWKGHEFGPGEFDMFTAYIIIGRSGVVNAG